MDFEGRLEELAADAEARISWWPPHVAALRRSAGEAGWRKPGELTFDGESSTVVCEGKPARWDPDATQFRCDEAALGARLAEERAHMERELAEGRFTTAWLLMSEPIESELRRRVEEGCRDAYLEASRRLSNPKVSAKLSLGWLAGQFDVEGRLSRGQRAHFLHLHPHQMVFPLESFRTPETIAAYSPPVLAGTYGIKTLVDIGLAPRSAIDALGYRHYGRLAGVRAGESA